MTPAPTKDSYWRYIGPYCQCPKNQVHKVIYTSPKEVITIGIPWGHGGSWLGNSQTFAQHFEYVGESL